MPAPTLSANKLREAVEVFERIEKLQQELSTLLGGGAQVQNFSAGNASASPRPQRTRPKLHRIGAGTQARLDYLMGKNNEGTINSSERKELNSLGKLAEGLSMKNARILSKDVVIRRRALMEREAVSKPMTRVNA